MAEVLVTLGIIGVIAAMTLSSLITKYQKYQTAIQLKAAYSMVGNIIDRSIADNGDPKHWNITSSKLDVINLYILPYVSNVIRIKNESAWTDEYKKNNPFGTGWIYYVDLTNGTRIIFDLWGRSHGADMTAYCGLNFIVDLNGKKTPNKWGRDLFKIRLNTSDSSLYFDGLYSNQWKNDSDYADCSIKLIQKSREEIKQQCINNLSTCGALIYEDSWEILDDYPWYK